MSSNCLVTKLKADASNEDLLKIGEIKIAIGKPYASASYGALTIYFHNPNEVIQINAVDGTFRASPTGTDITTINLKPAGGAIYASIYLVGAVTVSILNKYNIKALAGDHFVNKVYGYGHIIDALNTLPNCDAYQNGYCTLFGSVKHNESNVTSIIANFVFDNAPQDLADLALYFPNIEQLSATGLSGNLSSLLGLSELETLSIRDNNVEGDVSQLQVGTFNTIVASNLNFSWSGRSSTKEMILGDVYLATPADRKRMLVDNSNCVRSDQSTMGILKTLAVDTTDPDIAAALTRLRGKNVEVRRENGTILN